MKEMTRMAAMKLSRVRVSVNMSVGLPVPYGFSCPRSRAGNFEVGNWGDEVAVVMASDERGVNLVSLRVHIDDQGDAHDGYAAVDQLLDHGSGHLLARDRSEDRWFEQFQVLPTRPGNTSAAPLADGGLLNFAEPGHFGCTAEGVNNLRVNVLVHGAMLGEPYTLSIGTPIALAIRIT